VWIFIITVLCVQGCRTRTETPPDVTRAYGVLLGSLDPAAPGASFVKLEGFIRQNSQYALADAAEGDLRVWRGRLDSAYLKGRDLVREEQFDQAEAILKDLALAPDEKAGKLSKEFLAFEFPQMKATRLLQKGDTEGAQAVLRALTKQDLTADQMAAAQRLLDSTSVVGMANQMTRTTAIKSAARVLQVFLHAAYAENGQYPATLTLDSPELASLRGGGGLGDVVARIDDYRATADTFSLVLVGKDPRQRIRITQNGIEETP
jgi:hypothetical protein